MVLSRTLALIRAYLKKLLRDWKSLVMLTVFPLLIITVIFLSFNPGSINGAVGVVDNSSEFEIREFRNQTQEIATVRTYESMQQCSNEFWRTDLHMCILILEDPSQDDELVMNVFYDNTNQLVDEILLSQVQSASDTMQLDYSESQASVALNEINSVADEIKSIREELNQTDKELANETRNIDNKIVELEDARESLKNDFDDMDEDVDEFESDLETLNQTRAQFYRSSASRLETTITAIDMAISNSEDENTVYLLEQARSNVSSLNSDLHEYNQIFLNEIEDINEFIESYREFQERRQDYIRQINQTIDDLEDIKYRLNQKRYEIQDLEDNLGDRQKEYYDIGSRDPEDLTDFINVNQNQIYGSENQDQNLTVMQTVYPTLLFMVCLFVGILVSEFITLENISSPSKERMDVIPDTFLPEYLATFFTSILVLYIPVLCVLAFGHFLFKLPILSHPLLFASAIIITLLFNGIIVNIGMITAYMIRNKSVTLLIGSFNIVLLIFLSGFILPAEMMTPAVRTFSNFLPGAPAIELFKSVILFEGSYYLPLKDLFTLIIINMLLIPITLKIKSVGIQREKSFKA